MPKRMLDSSYLNSPSLDRCSPRAQDNFPRFILLADDFGCFEADTRRLLALGWTSRRTDVTEADIWSWLEEYVAAGMACVWTEKERRWCYLTGWHGDHGQKHRQEYDDAHPKGSKRHTPRPPPDLVAAVKAGSRRDVDGKPPGTNREAETKNHNDSVPARESEISRQIPGQFPPDSRQLPGLFPGSAVPVVVGTTAVPVPVPRSASDEPTRPEAPPEGAKTDPRYQPTVDALCAAFEGARGEKYVFKGRDGKAIRDHLRADPRATPEEAARRFVVALSLPRWPGCSTIPHLFERWNELAGPGPPALRRVIADSTDWSKPEAMEEL